MNLLFTRKQAEQILRGQLSQSIRPCKPQPVLQPIEGLGSFWVWPPALGRTFADDTGDPNALELPRLSEFAPFLPGDEVAMREPWMHVRTEPNGDYVIRYGDGEERTLTATNKDAVRIRWPHKWNSARNMYEWMERASLVITSAKLVRPTPQDRWVWVYEFDLKRR